MPIIIAPSTAGHSFSYPEKPLFRAKKGLTKRTVEEISELKSEPDWMRQARLKAYEIFGKKPMPPWGGDLSGIDFQDIYYFMRASERSERSWDDVDPDIKKTFDRLGIPEAERKFLAGVSAQYECLTGDTLVLANPAATPIKDIVPGMHVYALDEASKRIVKRNVLGVAAKGDRPVFEVNVGGRILKCTENHPFLQLAREREPGKKRGRFSSRWAYLKDLQAGDYVAVMKRLPDEGEPYPLPAPDLTSTYQGANLVKTFIVRTTRLFSRRQPALRIPEATSDGFMWLVGLYIGDGFLRRGRAGVEKGIVDIAIPASQTELRKRLQRTLADVFRYELRIEDDPFRVRIHSTPIARLFTAIGLDAHAKTKSIPKWMFRLPSSQKLAFLGGYIDADGYVRNGARNSDVLITSVNEPLLKQTQLLAISAGLHSSGPYRFTSRMTYKGVTRESDAYRLHVSGDLLPLVLHSWKVQTRFLPRKYQHTFSSAYGSPIDAHTSEDLGYARIRWIKPKGIETVYDIQVEGAKNFVAQGVIVHNSEVVYHSLQGVWEKQGVIFTDMDTALKQYPEMVREYFGTVIPAADNKFAALNTAVWSGGSFVYVPKGVHVEIPLQAYFRINAKNMGQFERTLIIAEEGSSVHYVEGCTAPTYSSDSLHSAVVEILVKKGAKVRYTTIQNWSKNVYNLVTKRAFVDGEGTMEWIDGNLGSRLTMKYPSVYLKGPGAHGEVLSIAMAGPGMHQDAGAKAFHLAPHTTSQIVSKSISIGSGRTSYRGMLKIVKGAEGSRSNVRCDALLLSPAARSDTYPTMQIDESRSTVEHEATVSRIGEEQLFYLMSRGLTAAQATAMIVRGFIDPFVQALPMEYSVELNRLIDLEMEGAVG